MTEDTKIGRQLSTADYTVGDISVSQRLDANSPFRRIVARILFEDPNAFPTADWVPIALA